MFLHYLKIAWRNLLKYKTQSVISVLGLAIGFVAFALGGYWYSWEHSFDTFHPDWKRTYAITTTGLLETKGAKHADLNQLHEEAKNYIVNLPEVESYSMTDLVAYMAEGNERGWNGIRVDHQFFQLFSCDLLEGASHGNAHDDSSVILTRSMARHLFGEEPCTGKLFKVNEKTSFTIAGVMEDYPGNTHMKFDYLLLGQPQYRERVRRLTTYVRVKEGVDINALSDKIAAYRMKLEDDKFNNYSEWRFNLCSLPDVHVTCSPNLDTRFRNIGILAVGGSLAFISALMNMLVLFISRLRVKSRYNSLYRIIGASSKGLIAKNLFELVLSLFIVFVLSMAIVELVFPLYSHYTRLDHYGIFENFIQYLSKKELVRTAVLAFWVSSTLFLILSAIPVWLLVKRKTSKGSGLFSALLIAGQVFIGSLFLIGAYAFYSQYHYTRDKDKGIVPENIWQIDIGFEAPYEKDPDQYIQLLRSSPYISDVTSLTIPVLSTLRQYYCSYVTRLSMNDERGDNAEDNVLMVEPNFLSFFGLQMKSGEWVSESGISEYVINETGAGMVDVGEDFSKTYEGPDSQGKPFRVTGILKDYHYFPIQYPLEKTFFHVLPEETKAKLFLKTPYIYIKVLPGNEEQALAFAKLHYADFSKGAVSPEKQFQYLPGIMEELNSADIHMSRIFLTLAITCILISSLGIYLLVALSTEQRRKEIAIRLINGASFADILKLFLGRYLVLTLIANTLSLPLGYLLVRRWLQTYAHHFTLSIGLFVLVLLITILIVVVSVAIQVAQVLRMNPVEVVKSD